jgi:hypothetical protein
MKTATSKRCWNLREDAKLEKASEYQEHARHCRILAANAANREHRGMLSKTASIWESLSKDREVRQARQQQISNLEAENVATTT